MNYLSNFDEKQGWHEDATLQHFKTFSFNDITFLRMFLIDLIQVETVKKIHMQVDPCYVDNAVKVMVFHEKSVKDEVKSVLLQIEEVYQNLIDRPQ